MNCNCTAVLKETGGLPSLFDVLGRLTHNTDHCLQQEHRSGIMWQGVGTVQRCLQVGVNIVGLLLEAGDGALMR